MPDSHHQLPSDSEPKLFMSVTTPLTLSFSGSTENLHHHIARLEAVFWAWPGGHVCRGNNWTTLCFPRKILLDHRTRVCVVGTELREWKQKPDCSLLPSRLRNKTIKASARGPVETGPLRLGSPDSCLLRVHLFSLLYTDPSLFMP